MTRHSSLKLQMFSMMDESAKENWPVKKNDMGNIEHYIHCSLSKQVFDLSSQYTSAVVGVLIIWDFTQYGGSWPVYWNWMLINLIITSHLLDRMLSWPGRHCWDVKIHVHWNCGEILYIVVICYWNCELCEMLWCGFKFWNLWDAVMCYSVCILQGCVKTKPFTSWRGSNLSNFVWIFTLELLGGWEIRKDD